MEIEQHNRTDAAIKQALGLCLEACSNREQSTRFLTVAGGAPFCVGCCSPTTGLAATPQQSHNLVVAGKRDDNQGWTRPIRVFLLITIASTDCVVLSLSLDLSLSSSDGS